MALRLHSRDQFAAMPFTPRPVSNYVLVKVSDAETLTRSGLLIPDNAKEKPCRGVIIECGPGRRDGTGQLIPMVVAVGDEVLWEKMGGVEIKVDDREYTVLRESALFAVVKDEA